MTKTDGPIIATAVQNIIMAMNRRVRITLENGNNWGGDDDEGDVTMDAVVPVVVCK